MVWWRGKFIIDKERAQPEAGTYGRTQRAITRLSWSNEEGGGGGIIRNSLETKGTKGADSQNGWVTWGRASEGLESSGKRYASHTCNRFTLIC